jgi:SAM-dependent methyltransferase
MTNSSCYRADFSLVYHRGFSYHANSSVLGILDLLDPVLDRGGLVLELGCGSGLLTKYLVIGGHRVIATDASPAMLDLARDYVQGEVDIRRLTLPADSLPDADAVVSVGHAISYLPDEQAADQALLAIARAVRPGGLFAIDFCDLSYGPERRSHPDVGMAGDDWAVVMRCSVPAPNRVVREITTFVPVGDGTWRRDDECHQHLLLDSGKIVELLTPEGIDVTVAPAFGSETLPAGLRVLIGRRPASAGGSRAPRRG